MIRNAVLKLFFAISGLAAIASGQTGSLNVPAGAVAIWGVQTDTPQWNQNLNVGYTRQGCSDPPASCMSFIGRVAASENVKVTLHIPLNSSTTVPYAAEYSQLSLDAPYLIEVSIDDFLSQFKALFTAGVTDPASLVANVIANVKSANPNLLFGATIYEDDLASPYLKDADLPAAVRAQFDYVHLFIHYREDGPHYAGYVAKARRVFPNAHIIAGSYAYDRRAFLPCAPKGQPCTAQQDFDLFKQSLTIQAQEVKAGVVDRIEFYPGYFGAEETWPSWTNPRECAATEIPQCIANTKVMREAALSILSASAAATWTELSPAGAPPAARYGHSAAIDSAHDRMIIFGGYSSASPLNDTWILTHADGQNGKPAWIPLAALNAPPTADYSTGMYDPASNRMILYGGAAGTDVWVLTNANGLGSDTPAWIQLSPTGSFPTPLTDWEKQVYDPVGNALVVYDTSAGVWILSNANGLGGDPVWSQLNVPANGPSTRAAFTAVYDPASNRLMVFGGSDGTNDFNDLWVLTGANGLGDAPAWIPLAPATATLPAGRFGHTAVYDPASDSMTIFGGIGQPADTWTAAHASGATQPPAWTLANSGVPMPDPRTDCTAVLDTNTFSMIVFGGFNTDFLNTLMVLSPVL